MPKVNHVKKSRKPVPQLDLPAGSEYYWWSMMVGSRGVKRYSKTPPTRSQLTNSEFLGRVYDIGDQLDAITDPDDLDSLIDDIRELGQEQEEKFNNLPDSLQSSSTGELLEGRASSCEEWASELEGLEKPEEVTDEDVEGAKDEAPEWTASDDEIRDHLEGERFDEFKNDVSGCQYGGE
jgi:hypothetical protein